MVLWDFEGFSLKKNCASTLHCLGPSRPLHSFACRTCTWHVLEPEKQHMVL
jgi:hypothetical protein